jgi:hypothetical protein
MKKVVFSLVAFMAFSVSAFANIVEVKEEAVEINKIDCDKVSSEVFWAWFSGGAGLDTANKKSAEAKASCDEENKKNSEKKSVGIYAY